MVIAEVPKAPPSGKDQIPRSLMFTIPGVKSSFKTDRVVNLKTTVLFGIPENV